MKDIFVDDCWLSIGLVSFVFVRSPFREEHLVVVPKIFFDIYANLARMSPFVPSCVPYVTPPV